MIRKSLSLHVDIIRAAEAAVAKGEAANLSAFVEEAVQEKLRRSKRSELYAAYAAAAQDAAFLDDMRATTEALDAAADDGRLDV